MAGIDERDIKAERARNAMTQQQLADAAGLSKFRLRQIESGIAAARVDELNAIGRALGLRFVVCIEPIDSLAA